MATLNILGVDTSNYTTSIALIAFDFESNKETVVFDLRKKLEVKKGSLGLRQSEAHFQHCNNFPILFEKIRGHKIDIVVASTTPRSVEGSYMPVFLAGVSFAKSISTALNVPFKQYSHQEGHLGGSFNREKLSKVNELAFFHLSGGTSEILHVSDYLQKIEVIGGSLDISIGQLLDRVGNKLGFDFPGGIMIDQLACNYLNEEIGLETDRKSVNSFAPIKLKDYTFNLSGIETEVVKKISTIKKDEIAYHLMRRVSEVLSQLVFKINKELKINSIVIGGGVANSKFIRNSLNQTFDAEKIDLSFAEFTDDNAVGLARIGGLSFGK